MLAWYWQQWRRYWQYYRRAYTQYDVHSPFLSALVAALLEDRRYFYAFEDIEKLRSQLLQDHRLLHIQDYGAGSKVNPSTQRRVSNIVRHSAVSPAGGQLLFRLAQFCKPTTMLEMGTSLGISTLYLATGARSARLISLEGCPDVAMVAQQHFEALEQANIELRAGTFQQELPAALRDLQRLDLLLLDGDHRAAPTRQYIAQCLPYAHESSVFVIADIHWSAEMEAAWHDLCQHPRVTLSVDLFHFGLLFFRPENREPLHVALIAKRYKPWRLGFFYRDPTI